MKTEGAPRRWVDWQQAWEGAGGFPRLIELEGSQQLVKNRMGIHKCRKRLHCGTIEPRIHMKKMGVTARIAKDPYNLLGVNAPTRDKNTQVPKMGTK